MVDRLMGYVAKYDGVDVYLISEKDYFDLKTPNPYIYYVIYRPKDSRWLVLQEDQIIGATDKSLNIDFWSKDENPNWKLAGMYSKLRERQAAYLKLEELENSFEKSDDFSEGNYIEIPNEKLEEFGVLVTEGDIEEMGPEGK